MATSIDVDLRKNDRKRSSVPLFSELINTAKKKQTDFSLNNLTENMAQENVTIIIESEDKSILTNDLKLNKLFKESFFAKLGIINISKNFARGLIIIKLKCASREDIKNILNIKKLGNWPIKSRLPVNQSMVAGVIGPIGHDTDLTDLKTELNIEYPEIIKVERIFKNKGKEKIPTLCIKLTFDTDKLPDYIYLGYQRFKVSIFIDKPWQCYRCQGFGHNAAECKSRPKCLLCAGGHEFQRCPLKTTEHSVTDLKCSNCSGKHAANFGGCPKFKIAKKVEEVRTKNKISYKEAVMKVKTSEASPNPNSREIPSRKLPSRMEPSSCCEAGTQTEKISCENNALNLSTTLIENIVKIMFQVVHSKKQDMDTITSITKEILRSNYAPESNDRERHRESDVSSDESVVSSYSMASSRRSERHPADEKRNRSSSRDKMPSPGKKKKKKTLNHSNA